MQHVGGGGGGGYVLYRELYVVMFTIMLCSVMLKYYTTCL